jgi:hypothetical protein
VSYEVYIDVRHHPRHLEDWEQTISDCGKFSKPDTADPTPAERMRTVCAALESMADHLDPDRICSHCGKARHEHHCYPSRLVYCDEQRKTTTQWSWWETPKRRQGDKEDGE